MVYALARAAASNCSLVYFPNSSSRDAFGGFAAVLEVERGGGFELVEVLHDEIGNVELEPGAFEAQALHADLLFAQANDEADDFAVKAGGDLGHVHDFHRAVDEHGDDGFFHGVRVTAGHEEFFGGFCLFAEVYACHGQLSVGRKRDLLCWP